MEYNPIGYFKKKRNKRLILVLAFLIVITLLYLFGSPPLYERSLPKLVNAKIVVRAENEDVARDEPRIAELEEMIIMYAVIEGKGPLDKETTFFTEESAKIIIDGKEIPDDRIEKWDDYWKSLDVAWIKIEPRVLRQEGKGQEDLSFLKYKHRWRFDNRYYWALPADAKPTSIIEWEVQQVRLNPNARFSDPRNYPGTMYFKIYAAIYRDDDAFNPISEASTPGEESLGADGLSPEIMRVTFVEDRSFVGYCTGFFNVVYIDGNEELIKNTCATERYMAISNRSYIYESAIQAGYDLESKSIEGLRKACDVVHRDVYLMHSNNIYKGRTDPQMLTFSRKGVLPGDILVIGKNKKMAVLYSDGGLEVEPDKLFDGTDVVLCTGKDGLEKNYLANVIDDQFEIWRLREQNK